MVFGNSIVHPSNGSPWASARMGTSVVSIMYQTNASALPISSPLRTLLPSPETLLLAIRGHLDDRSPITDRARQLGCLYRELIADPLASEPIRVRIGDISGEIDRWICGQLPRPNPGAFPVMDSVGGVIARLAEAHEFAFWALMHYPAADLHVHRSWDHLAEMRCAYAEFATHLLAGAIALPKSWPGIESMERGLTK